MSPSLHAPPPLGQFVVGTAISPWPIRSVAAMLTLSAGQRIGAAALLLLPLWLAVFWALA
ncbi:MAG: hypothetical protein ACOVOG_18575 [Rubrivivax sp.]